MTAASAQRAAAPPRAFDRFLLAQADVERLQFLTADQVLLGLGLRDAGRDAVALGGAPSFPHSAADGMLSRSRGINSIGRVPPLQGGS